jgi:phospholipid N-methyltransferase
MVEFTSINPSESDNGDYVAAVNNAVNNYEAFLQFKRHPAYAGVLEHASYMQGAMCLEAVNRQSPEMLKDVEKYQENDLVGGSSPNEYSIGMLSPSTLRYMKVASDIKILFGNVDKVAEIGIGYGGQMLVLDRTIQMKEYHLFDLQPVLRLAEKYLEHHILNASYKTTTLNQHRGDVEYDLIVSNYAYSELPKELEIKYIEKVLSKAKRGYLTMNSGLPNSCFTNNKLTLAELKELLPKFEVIEEYPNTFPNNYIIVWGHKLL